MILVATIAFSLVLARLRGGRFKGLVNVPLRWGALAAIAFAIQAAFIYQTPSHDYAGALGREELLLIGSHVLLIAVVWANRRLPGIHWLGLGLLLNLLAMVANGGWMPVTPEALTEAGHTGLVPSLASGTRVYSSKNIVLPRAETRLWVLSDVFILARPFPVPSIFSVGDLMLAVGVFQLIQGAMLGSIAQTRRH